MLNRTTTARHPSLPTRTPWDALPPVTLVLLLLLLGPAWPRSAHGAGEVELTIVDATTGQSTAARMSVTTPRGGSARPRGGIVWKNHFVTDGPFKLRMPDGRNTFVVERGLEYRAVRGHVDVTRGAEDVQQVTLQRFVNLREEGWWSGDIDVQRPVDQVPTLLDAEDLQFAVVAAPPARDSNAQPSAREPQTANEPTKDAIGPDAETAPWTGPDSAGDEREFDARTIVVDDGDNLLLLARLEHPLEPDANRTAVQWAELARAAGGHVCVGSPTSWDLPVLIAHDLVDSIAVMNRQTAAVQPARRTGVPAPRLKYPPPRGHGRWSHDIYFHLLNCGLRIPCVAGSGTGVSGWSAGQARTYVPCGPTADMATWWTQLEAGQSVISNGPLLRPRCNQQLPGHVFVASAGDKVELQLVLKLATRTRIDYLEILRDGQVAHHIRLPELASSSGQLPKVEFDASGWLSVQAVTNTAEAHELALSGPFYVEVAGQRRISRASAQMFLDWVERRAQRPDAQRPEVRRELDVALEYWRKMVVDANAP